MLLVTALFLSFCPVPKLAPKAAHSPNHYTPQFKPNDCFIHHNIREPWEPPVDGVIVAVGYAHYLVMYYPEADRRHGGAKIGLQEDMQDFDKRYHPSTCPSSWQHREGKK